MAITFDNAIINNTGSSTLNKHEQLNSARGFIAKTVHDLRGIGVHKFLPGIVREPYHSEISGNGVIHGSSIDKAHFGFFLTNDHEKGTNTLHIVQQDPFLHESRGGYTPIMKSTGSWKEIYNDMRTLRPEMLQVDKLSQVDFRNVTLIAAATANFKNQLSTAQDHLSDFTHNNNPESLKLAASSLNKALYAFGPVSDKQLDEIKIKDGQFTFPPTHSLTALYGTPKESKEIGRLPQDGLFVKLEESHNLDNLKGFIGNLQKTRGTLVDHVNANAHVLSNSSKTSDLISRA